MNWAMTEHILWEVLQERKRQHEKWGLQRHTPERWLTIAIEEIGEWAQAIQKGSVASKPTDADSKIYEAIQAAAVLVAYAEQELEQMQPFQPCDVCKDPDFCQAFGKLCEGIMIGDSDGGEKV